MRDANSDGKPRLNVATDLDYEVKLLSEQAGISFDQARELIQEHGSDWPRLQEQAAKLRGSGS